MKLRINRVRINRARPVNAIVIPFLISAAAQDNVEGGFDHRRNVHNDTDADDYHCLYLLLECGLSRVIPSKPL